MPIDPVEQLKPLQEIFECDPRNKIFISVRTGEPRTLEDHYSFVNKIKLNHGVDDDALIQFNVARNTFLYSWFSYRLGMVAAKQAFATMEFALRKYLAVTERRKNTLVPLLRRAQSKQVIKLHKLKPHLQPEHYIEILSNWRNSLGHGSTTLLEPTIMAAFIRDCAEIINQLYETVRRDKLEPVVIAPTEIDDALQPSVKTDNDYPTDK